MYGWYSISGMSNKLAGVCGCLRWIRDRSGTRLTVDNRLDPAYVQNSLNILRTEIRYAQTHTGEQPILDQILEDLPPFSDFTLFEHVRIVYEQDVGFEAEVVQGRLDG